MYGILYDRPAMEPAIRESIRLTGLNERATPMTGDYLTDDIGDGYDLILAIATLSFVEHELAGLDELAFAVQALLDDALHTGTHFDGPGAGGLGLEFGRPGHVLGFHLEDAHRRGGHLTFLSTFILACRKAETEKQQQRCQNGLFSGHDILLLGQQRTADTWKARPQSERALDSLLNIFCKMRQEMQAYLALKVQ